MIGSDWPRAFDNCYYWLVRPRRALRVIGWADKLKGEVEPEVLVGLEPWLIARLGNLSFGPWRNSAIEHELTHIWQEYDRNLLSLLWEKNLTRLRKWQIWLDAEWEAVTLNPLWPWSIVFVGILPVVASFIKCGMIYLRL